MGVAKLKIAMFPEMISCFLTLGNIVADTIFPLQKTMFSKKIQKPFTSPVRLLSRKHCCILVFRLQLVSLPHLQRQGGIRALIYTSALGGMQDFFTRPEGSNAYILK